MIEKNGIYFIEQSPQMQNAYQEARRTFPYFWRELWWERRRIIPGLDLACVKATFCQEVSSGEPLVEHMWINEIDFDGITVKGILINQPNELTNIRQGDGMELPVQEIDDWLFAIRQTTYGGFSIQVLREEMDNRERKKHDEAWGLNFGDPGNIMIAYEQDKHPENLVEHPMSRNTAQSLQEFLAQNPDQLTWADEAGYTMLHREAIAGNKTCVELLLQLGAHRDAKTNTGYTASDFAQKMQWEHLIPVLA